MSTSPPQAPIPRSQHISYLNECLSLAKQSPRKPTNFRVGAVLVSYTASHPTGQILSTGYTLELSGNTHAEQNAFAKLSTPLTAQANAVLYTSMEPCSVRLSGNTACVRRIIATREADAAGGVRKVVFGAKEPGTFVRDSKSCQILDEAGVEWEYVPDLEAEILAVAKEGHVDEAVAGEAKKETRIDNISPEERKRQEAQPRNPKKRMMEAPVG